MIKRTLLYTVGLLLAYSVILEIPTMRHRFAVQSLWQDNLIRFQEFTFQQPRPEHVIVGSSLVRNIDTTAISPTCYNLAASGGNVLSGLKVLSRQSQLPQVVFVEVTMFMNDETEGLADNTVRPVFAQLRPWLPMLRERYQPANFFAAAIGAHVIQRMLTFAPSPLAAAAPNEGALPAQTRLAETRAREIARRQTLLDPQTISARATLLQQHIDALIVRGARVVIIDLPHDAQVMDTPRIRQMRDALSAQFPSSTYTWIRPDPTRAYDTTDAIHLTKPELQSYERAMHQQIRKL